MASFAKKLAEALGVRPGVTAVIGSGGKTTLLRILAEGLPGTVLLCTSTHIFPFPGVPLLESPEREALRAAFAASRVVCAGVREAATGNLTALPYRLAGLCDYVLVEADGAAGRPLKGHAPWEPAIPPEAGRVIQVAGMSGLGRPMAEAVHRPEYFCRLCGLDAPEGAVRPEQVAEVLRRERLSHAVLLNQAEDHRPEARSIRALLPMESFLGSLRQEWIE